MSGPGSNGGCPSEDIDRAMNWVSSGRFGLIGTLMLLARAEKATP
jgi:hypothetical protein